MSRSLSKNMWCNVTKKTAKMSEEEKTEEKESFIMSGLATLLKTGLHSDFVIVAGSGESQESFNVHRCILSMNSEFFARVSKPDTFKEGQEGRLELPEVAPETMKQVIEFLYTEAYEATNLVTHARVFTTALYLQLQPLAQASIKQLSDAIGLKEKQCDPLSAQVQEELFQALDIVYSESSEQDRLKAGVGGLCSSVYKRCGFWESDIQNKFDEVVAKHGCLGRDLMKRSRWKTFWTANNCDNCKALTENLLSCNHCNKCPYDTEKTENMARACPLCLSFKGFVIVCYYCRKPKTIF